MVEEPVTAMVVDVAFVEKRLSKYEVVDAITPFVNEIGVLVELVFTPKLVRVVKGKAKAVEVAAHIGVVPDHVSTCPAVPTPYSEEVATVRSAPVWLVYSIWSPVKEETPVPP